MHGNKQSRRFLLTINNPQDKGINFDTIQETINNLKSTEYYCMASEVGESGTPHIHIFIVFGAPVRFSTIKNKFPTAHIDRCKGTAQENRDYVGKLGKWRDTAKAETVTGDFCEWGTIPEDRQGERKDLALMYEMIKQGASDLDIFEENPAYIRFVSHIEKVRQALSREKKQTAERDVKVIYMYGCDVATRLRYIYDRFGYDKVYRVVDYDKHPFDGYNCEDIVVFDFFEGGFPITQMNGMFMLGLPLELSCRYNNKMACYTTLVISADVSPVEIYIDVKVKEQRAFYSNLSEILYFNDSGEVDVYTSKDLLKGRLPMSNNSFD